MPDNHILRHQRMAMLELLQKHIRQRDLAELQPMLITLLAQGYLTENQINTLISYMLQAGTSEKTWAPDSRAGEAVAQAQGATDDNCRMAGRERP